jgi:hypothetical protein
MYGILAACIAIMAVFLGLFAISVEPPTDGEIALSVEQTAHVQVRTVSDKAPTDKQ